MPVAEFPITNFPEESLTRIDRGGVDIVVIRANGLIRAYRNQCPHAFWPLSEGSLRANILECPGHGWEFDIASGRCLSTPDYCLSPITISIQGDLLILKWTDLKAGSEASTCNK